MGARISAALAGVVLAGAIAASLLPDALSQTAIRGEARVVDGDSLVVAGTRVRLAGVDAPELRQECDGTPCGLAAKAALDRIIGRDTVSCAAQGQDRYGRTLAVCSTTTVPDLGALMIGSGHAVDYTRYSKGRYKDEEAAARAEKLGIWRAPFTRPEDWRHGR